MVILPRGSCRARGAPSLLFLEQFWGCYHKFSPLRAGTQPGKHQEKLAAAERQTACAPRAPCQDFQASLKRTTRGGQDRLLPAAGGMMEPYRLRPGSFYQQTQTKTCPVTSVQSTRSGDPCLATFPGVQITCAGSVTERTG